MSSVEHDDCEIIIELREDLRCTADICSPNYSPFLGAWFCLQIELVE